MSLTGSGFLAALAAATASAFVVLVARWGALAGRGPVRIALRASSLLLINLLVLLLAATALNARFLFFADWRDLSGALGGSNTTTVSRGSAAAAAGHALPLLGGAVGPSRLLPPVPPSSGGVSGGGVRRFSVTGALSHVTGTVVVRLPPGYNDAGNAGVRYPVLETFHGYPGTAYQWLRTLSLDRVMAQQVNARRMRTALIVSPTLETPPGVDTECVNGSAGRPQLETWLTRDVPNWVTHTFRVRPERSSWATIGLSTGGWCAAMAAMLHPDRYAAAVVLAGYFRPVFGPFYEPFPAGSRLASRYDLLALARRAPPPVAIWLETSHSDHVSYRSSAALLKAARAPTAVRATVLRHAGHRMSIWQGLVPGSLAWLGSNISGFRPV